MSSEDSATTAAPKPTGWLRVGPDGLLLALIIAIVVFNQFFGEKIDANGGVGYNGVGYAAWARDFRGTVLAEGLSTYHVRRLLPSAVVHLGLYLCGAEMTDANIIRSFIIMNTICQLMSLWVWSWIARELGLGVYGRCLSLAGIFLNFYFLRSTSFCPVMTDDAAFLIALLQFLFFLRSKTIALLLTTAVGAFVWSTSLEVGTCFAVFPRAVNVEPSSTRFSLRAAVAVAAAIASGFVLVFVVMLRRGHLIPHNYAALPLREVLPLSVVLAVGTIVAGLIPLLNDRRLFSVPLLYRALSVRNAVLAVAVALAARAIQWSLTAPGWTSAGLLKFLIVDSVVLAVAKPGITLLAHIVFWGPVVWLLVFYWKTVCRSIQRMGVGMILVATLGFLLAIGGEQRYILNIMPMVVLLGVQAVEHQIPARLMCWILVPACLFASRVWFTINVPGRPFELSVDFPAQRFFMSRAPWMSTPSYLVQFPLAVGLGLVIYVVCARVNRHHGTKASTGGLLTADRNTAPSQVNDHVLNSAAVR